MARTASAQTAVCIAMHGPRRADAVAAVENSVELVFMDCIRKLFASVQRADHPQPITQMFGKNPSLLKSVVMQPFVYVYVWTLCWSIQRSIKV
jgi:hypothetical protein